MAETSRPCSEANGRRSARRSATTSCGTVFPTWLTIWSCPPGTPPWSSIRTAGAQAALEILEFANSQLLEFRHYDERLDTELTSIYAALQQPRWYDKWIGSRYTRAARQVHALFIEVSDVTDRTKNALKLTGDVYAARLFTLASDRLGLGAWKGDVESKLKTLDEIYRSAVEQSAMSRGQLLELAVVLILVFELILFFLGIMT